MPCCSSCATTDKVNHGKPDEMEISGFKRNKTKLILTSVLVVLTGGLFLLLLSWRKSIKLHCIHDRVKLDEAEVVLLKDAYNEYYEEKVDGKAENIYFINKDIKYVWVPAAFHYEPLPPFDDMVTQASFYSHRNGLNENKISELRQKYGENIIKIHVRPILTLIFSEAVNPFYIFQVYTVIIWTIQTYYSFAVLVAVLSLVSIAASVWESRRQSRALRNTMKSQSEVKVLRNGEEKVLPSPELVPGDVLVIPSCGRYIFECDAVLFDGNCSVNEAFLTGESVPVTKTPVPNAEDFVFQYQADKQHVLFCGSELLQGRPSQGDSIRAVVIRTGFMSMKGELVRSILFPRPVDFQFYSDFMRCIIVFLFLGIIGMIYSFWIWSKRGATLTETLLNGFDILTFVVPPVLPAALTAINYFAQRRLQKEGIFCISSKYIGLCGGVDLVCFDKTGTLTDSFQDLVGIVPAEGKQFSQPVMDATHLKQGSRLLSAMATCHSLIKLNQEIVGSPLEIRVFEATNWTLYQKVGIDEEFNVQGIVIVCPPGESVKDEIAILKQYPFESSQQRMTVVTRQRGGEGCDVYIKGAPEKVADLCDPKTVSDDFQNVLEYYTQQGLRVMGVAWNPLKVPYDESMERNALENHSVFLGFLILQNRIKPDTMGVLSTLREANIPAVMVTGDNILTAITVSRDSGLVTPDEQIVVVTATSDPSAHLHVDVTYKYSDTDGPIFLGKNASALLRSVHGDKFVFAIEGTSFALIRQYRKDIYNRILHRGRVFARMLPQQKIHLVEGLQALGHQVGMCGDGCNDCGALKAAHAGVALSVAEASVAAPFTSLKDTPQCVPTLIREGRATLVSAISSFKFGVTSWFLQFISVLMLFYIATEPHDNQYIIMDLVLTAIPMVIYGNVAAYPKLVPQLPDRHLLRFLPLFSIISFIGLQTILYVIVWHYCEAQPWFEPFEYVVGKVPPNPSYEQTTLYLVNCASYVIGSVIFSKGTPYRKHFLTNKIFTVWLVLATAIVVVLSITRYPGIINFFHMRVAPEEEFGYILLCISLTNFLFCFVWEYLFIKWFLAEIVLPRMRRESKKPFHITEKEIKRDPKWPPLHTNPQTEDQLRITMPPISEESSKRERKSFLVPVQSTKRTPNDASEDADNSNIAILSHIRESTRPETEEERNKRQRKSATTTPVDRHSVKMQLRDRIQGSFRTFRGSRKHDKKSHKQDNNEQHTPPAPDSEEVTYAVPSRVVSGASDSSFPPPPSLCDDYSPLFPIPPSDADKASYDISTDIAHYKEPYVPNPENEDSDPGIELLSYKQYGGDGDHSEVNTHGDSADDESSQTAQHNSESNYASASPAIAKYAFINRPQKVSIPSVPNVTFTFDRKKAAENSKS